MAVLVMPTKPGQPSTLSSSSSSAILRAPRNPAIRIRQAVRDNNVSLLQRLSEKTDLRNTDRNRLTSLSWAAVEGSLEVFEWLLLDYGHDDQELSRDSDNNTILHLLASVPSTQPTSLPFSTAFPPLPPSQTLSPFEQSRRSLHLTQLYHTLFPFLLDWSNSGGKTALHIAAQSGNTPFISLLLSFGADPDLTDLQGNSPLHYAAAWGHVDVARTLLDGGAVWGIRNFEGFNPRDYAFSDDVKGKLEGMWEGVKVNRRARRRAEAEAKAAGMRRDETEVGEMYQGISGQGRGQGQGAIVDGNRLRSDSESIAASYVGSGTGISGSGPGISNPTQGFPFGKPSKSRSNGMGMGMGGMRDLPGPPVTQYPRQTSPVREYSSPPVPDSGYATPRYDPPSQNRGSPYLSHNTTPALSRHNSDGPIPSLSQRSSPNPPSQAMLPQLSISRDLSRTIPSPTQEGYKYVSPSADRPNRPGRSPSLPSRAYPMADGEKTPARSTAEGPPVFANEQALSLSLGVPVGDEGKVGMRRSHMAQVGLGFGAGAARNGVSGGRM